MTDRTTTALTENADDLLRYFRRRVGDDDAPYLLADTLMTAWRRSSVLPHDPNEARARLFGIAHKTLLNYLRGIQRHNRLADRVRTILATTDAAPAADAGLDVRDAINALDSRHAEIVRLVHWEASRWRRWPTSSTSQHQPFGTTTNRPSSIFARRSKQPRSAS